ncbi:MAG: PD-(D/E)XK nuclease family protein [Phycisphaerae bacterium]|nr:PD-(D/E)XK nuclease family protein [Phycisphaerae bacterium]
MAIGSANLVEEILRAGGPVLLAGPAGAGVREVAMAFYRRHVDSAGRGRCVLVAPNGITADRLRRQLLAESGAGVLLSPPVMTFATLAGRLLAGAGSAATLLSPAVRHQRLRQIVRELVAAGRLRALTAVAETPGVIAALDRAIAELKRAAVEPEDLARALAAAPAEPKQADLLEIYRWYQQDLISHNEFDVEGHMWMARRLLAEWPAGEALPALEGVAAVALVGFTDLTPTQLRMLGLLASRMERLLVTLPHGLDSRERMWRWTARTRQQLRAEFGPRLREIDLPPAATPTPLAGLAATVFDLGTFRAAPDAVPPGLTVIAAAGLDAELSAVARRVKRRLVDTVAGEKPHEQTKIAVLARSLEAVAPTLERIFAEHRIPIAPRPAPLTQSPLTRFVLDAADIAVNGEFPFRHVLRTIRNSYFRPRALGPDFDAQTVWLAETIIREGNVLGGRAAYGRAAERLKARLLAATDRRESGEAEDATPGGGSTAQRLGDMSVQPADLTRAAAMLDTLFDACESATSPAGLLRLTRRLELRQAILDQYPHTATHDRPAANASPNAARIAADLRALATLEKTLADLHANESPDAPLTPADIRSALSAALIPAARSESLVDVLDVLDARALHYDHVFLVGVEEGAFPQPARENALIHDANRAAWARHGLVLDGRGDLNAREMVLFYLAVTRAKRSLTISFQSSDTAGKPKLASAFLESLLASVGGLDAVKTAGQFVEIPADQFIPPPADIASPRDAFAARALSQPHDTPPHAPRNDRPADATEFLAAGQLAMQRRWETAECDGFDGQISHDDLLERLRQAVPDEMVFSASSLNAYGQCPWQFFASYLLHLRPLAVPQRQLEAVSAGTFCHNVLWRVVSELTAHDPTSALVHMEPSRVETALADALAAEAARVEATAPPYPVLWALQREQLAATLRNYVKNQLDDTLLARPIHCEFAFGTDAGLGPADDMLDPKSRREPVTLGLPGTPDQPGATIRLRGKIDRIDRVEIDGAAGMLVVDYKTGPLPTGEDIRAARHMQLPLYVEAARTLLGGEGRSDGQSSDGNAATNGHDDDWLGGAFHRVGGEGEMRFFGRLSRRAGLYQYKTPDPANDPHRQALQCVAAHIHAMRQGQFHTRPAATCPPYCPYRQICHVSPARARRKNGDTETQ